MFNTFLFVFCLVLSTEVRAFGDEMDPSEVSEEHYVVANGQGISSPSFSDGLFGQNPAGLVLNRSLKLKINGNVGTFEPLSLPRGTYTSASLLVGNGILGAGVSGGGRPYDSLDWGIAGRVPAIFSTFGLSSHTEFGVTPSLWDTGVLFEPFDAIRVGFMVPHINLSLDSFAGGITYLYNSYFDAVVDIDYDSKYSLGVLKPGITFRNDYVEATAAYGLRYLGKDDALLYSGLSVGIGLKVIEPLLVSYEYGGLVTHRLGVTLRVLLQN